MEISEGVIRLGLRPRRITPSSISIIPHKILSLIHELLNKANNVRLNCFRNNDIDAQVKFTLKVMERAVIDVTVC